MTTCDLTVANTILAQLGGNKFRAMTGAKNFVGGKDQLMFQIPKAKKGINKVRIWLTPADTYTVEFTKVVKFNFKVVETVENVYCDNLQEVFTRNTGLDTRL